jgi:adenylyltransferase/sulfurtransferase
MLIMVCECGVLSDVNNGVVVYVCCRQGNDSQKAVLIIKKELVDCKIQDLIGGLKSWTDTVDESFPKY